MPADNRYKGLEINEDNILGWAEAFCSMKGLRFVEMNSNKKEQASLYEIFHDNELFSIRLSHSNGNRNTLTYKVGRKQDVSKEFADFILERLSNTNIAIADDNRGFKVRITPEDFESFIDLLKDEDIDILSHNTHGAEEQYKLKSIQYHDEIMIHYYNTTHNVFIQGRRLQLFNKATDLLAIKCKLVDVVNAEIRYDSISVTSDIVLEHMKTILGEELYGFLSETQKAIMSNSFKFYRVDMDSLDYSVLIEPMCRAMEGYIYKLFDLFENKGIIIEDEDNGGYYGIGHFFRDEEAKTNPLKLKEEFASKIDNEVIDRAFNNIYDWYYNNRHKYSHSGPYDNTTAIIETRKIADIKFNEVVDIYRNTYETIMGEIRKR